MRRVETTERDVRDLVCLADEGGVGGVLIKKSRKWKSYGKVVMYKVRELSATI